MDYFEGIAQSFVKTFINDDRWLQLLNGLGVTILITLVAAAIGVVLGFLIAMVRSTYDMQLQGKKCRKPNDYVLKVLNVICNFYITIIRGTPVVIQLMIMYFIVFASSRAGIVAAFLLSFAMSADDFIVTYFTKGAGIETLTTEIYAELKLGIHPEMYALSTLFFVAVIVLVTLLLFNYRMIRRYRKAEKREAGV